MHQDGTAGIQDLLGDRPPILRLLHRSLERTQGQQGLNDSKEGQFMVLLIPKRVANPVGGARDVPFRPSTCYRPTVHPCRSGEGRGLHQLNQLRLLYEL